MKYLILIIFFLPFAILAKPKPNAVDSIKTDQDVIRFLISNLDSTKNINFKYFSFRDNPGNNDSIFNRIYDSVVKPKWYKGDFNRDKLTDLLFSGFYDTEYVVYLVLAKPGGKFELMKIQKRFDLIFAQAIRHKNNDYILSTHSDRTKKIFSNHLTFVADTLIYQKDHLEEYNELPPNLKLDSLCYFGSFGMDFCAGFRLSLNSKGLARFSNSYKCKEYNGIGKIDKNRFYNIRALISRLELSNSEYKYYAMATDMPSAVIIFYFNGNKQVHISDYGKQGSYSLSELYRLLDDLLENQGWINKR